MRRGTSASSLGHCSRLSPPTRGSLLRPPPLPYGPVPGGTHVPAEDGALTPELVQSLIEQATAATYVVVTPWRGVLVPNAPEVSE